MYPAGYHRGTNLEHHRAPGSTDQHLKQETRHKAALRRVEHWCQEYGAKGDAVVRFEWRSWKRILRCGAAFPWRPVKSSAQTVSNRMYRKDKKSKEDWSLVCKRCLTRVMYNPRALMGRRLCATSTWPPCWCPIVSIPLTCGRSPACYR